MSWTLIKIMAAVVLFLAAQSCMKSPPDKQSREEKSPLATDLQREVSPKCGKPSWVDDPESFFEEPREDLYLAVGQARVRGPDPMWRGRAKQDALLKLTKLQEGISESKLKVGKVEFTRSKTGGFISGAETLAQWKSPEDAFFILMSVKKKY